MSETCEEKKEVCCPKCGEGVFAKVVGDTCRLIPFGDTQFHCGSVQGEGQFRASDACTIRSLQAENERLRETACRFLLWFNRDGSPCDGFKFQERREELAKLVNFEQWIEALNPKVTT